MTAAVQACRLIQRSEQPPLPIEGPISRTARKLFEGDAAQTEDDRKDYDEKRYITAGDLDGRMVVVVWTPRGDARRVFR